MYHKLEAWLNDILGQKIPSVVKAFCFNLYEDDEGWSIELVGTESFRLDDEDWACDEITDFGTREKPLSWKEEADWKEVLSEVSSAIKQYLANGSYADILKSCTGVAVGFVDGNLEILYSNLSGVTQELPILTHGLEYDEKIARQNIEADGETLDREFGKKPTDMRMVIAFIVIIVLVMFSFCVLGLIISSRNKANSENTPQQTEHFDESVTEVMTEGSEAASESATEVEKDSFFLHYIGRDDTELEIFFKDCVCEYDRDGIRVYTCYVDDPAVETEGYAICIQSPEKMEDRFSKDYLIDQDVGCIYSLLVEMRDGIEIFTRIQAELVNGTANYVVANKYTMEWLIAETYGLEYLDNGEDFDCHQVEFTGLFDENGKTVLRGRTSALYNASGKRYSIEWEIDTETLHESAKAYLTYFDIHPLYAAFLQNEISVSECLEKLLTCRCK